MIYAHVIDGVVRELFSPPSDVPIADCFHADIVAQFVDVTSVSPEPQPGWTYSGTAFAAPVALQFDIKPIAQMALDRSDMTALRCFKANIPFPNAWQNYVTTLRAIVSGSLTPTDLPVQPAYPNGT